jgi:hypothetical protein
MYTLPHLQEKLSRAYLKPTVILWETWEEQLGEGSMERKARDTPDLQATDKGTLAAPISTAMEGN